MTLSQEQLDHYHAHGYVVLPGLFAEDELTPLRQASDTVAFGERRYPEHNVLDDNGAVRIAFGLRGEADVFDHLSRSSRILEPVHQLLGDEIYLFEDRLSPKKGRAGDAFGWHQDFAPYVHSDGVPEDSYEQMVSAMVMLDDSRPEKGCLKVIDQSHAGGLMACHFVPEVTGRRAFHIDDAVDESRAVDIVGPPGTVLLFSTTLVHGSNKNLTDEPRRALFFVYNRLDNIPTGVPEEKDQPRRRYEPESLEPMAEGY